MARIFKVMDVEKNKEKDVKSFEEVINFLAVQTQHLLIRPHLTEQELTELKQLEHASGKLTLLDRFVVISQIGA